MVAGGLGGGRRSSEVIPTTVYSITVRSVFCVQILALPLVTCIQQGITSLGFRIHILEVETIVPHKTVVRLSAKNLRQVFSLSFEGIINAQYMFVIFVVIILNIKIKIMDRKWKPM